MATKPVPKKPAPATAVATRATGAVALPRDVMDEMAQYAKDAAAKERPSVTKLSLKGGMLAYQGQEMPNNEMEVVLLASSFMNTLYLSAYDPDNIKNPDCFALALEEDDLKPHDVVTDPHGGEDGMCASCPNAQWGTGMRDGKPTRGKLCKEKRRLIVMPASSDEETDFLKAEMAILEISVTNVGHYAAYVNQLAATAKKPMWAVRTLVTVSRHRTNQYELSFTMLGELSLDEYNAVKARREEGTRLALLPFGPADEEETIAPPPPPKPAPKAPAKPAARR